MGGRDIRVVPSVATEDPRGGHADVVLTLVNYSAKGGLRIDPESCKANMEALVEACSDDGEKHGYAAASGGVVALSGGAFGVTLESYREYYWNWG
jgi:hypothetical protein